MVGDTWSPTASMRNLKYFLAGVTKHKAIVHQLYLIWAFLQAKVKNRLFLKLDSIYTDYFPEYAKYFGIALRLLKSVYGTTTASADASAAASASISSAAAAAAVASCTDYLRQSGSQERSHVPTTLHINEDGFHQEWNRFPGLPFVLQVRHFRASI